MMKKASLTLLAALTAAAAVAAPALAQPYGPPPPPGYGAHNAWDIDRRIDWTQQRINRGVNDGSLDRHEFRRVQGQLNGIRHEFQRIRYREAGHVDQGARDMLSARLDHLNDEIHWLRGNPERRPW